MKVRSAAQIGIVLVVVHLIIAICMYAYHLLMYLPSLFHSGSQNVVRVGGYIFTSRASLIGEILLNLALILVFSSLGRTREQFYHDNPDIPA